MGIRFTYAVDDGNDCRSNINYEGLVMPKSVWAMDTECYRDYWLIMLKNVDTGQVWYDELYEGHPLSFNQLPDDMTFITFNGINYDFPILSLALAGYDNAALKQTSDDIILRRKKPWEISGQYAMDLLHGDHIDLIEVAPGQCSLKIYGGRLNSKRLQDLPIRPDASISVEDRISLRRYCENDLDTTIDLYRKLKPQIELRESMSAEYGIDLRSKSDAQIAEAVIRQEVEKRINHKLYRPELHLDYKFKYIPPSWVRFASPGMNQALRLICDMDFALNDKGSVVMPPLMESMNLMIGNAGYRMGIGGLHSSEESVRHVADNEVGLFDRDVTSYYPSIILNQGLYPAHMGRDFLEVYRGIVERRIAAKKAKDSVTADALKICINGSFGKFGSKWSVLYSPDLLIQVTLTGQLALLMLIESIEDSGIRVVSANTDGVVIKCPRSRKAELDALVMAWELTTGFATEETEYKLLASRDVNNYIAVKTDGSVKLKGAYGISSLQKNTANEIAIDAVIKFLAESNPIRETIQNCTDIKKFITIRKVEGGAVHRSSYLGKSIRWYYSIRESGYISYFENNHKVPRTEGAMPVMELPDVLPDDIDYDWYVREAQSILKDIGYAHPVPNR